MDISLVIIAMNEAQMIRRCIESVPFADEVIVVDSGSTDSTAQIAEDLGASVLSHEFQNFSAQKQWAIEQAEGRWILSLDADEYLSGKLADEMKLLLRGETDHAGFRLPFRILYMGRLMRFGPWSGEDHLRLFRNGLAVFPPSGVHEGPVLTEGSEGVLRHGCVIHESYASMSDQMNKMLRYSEIWAAQEYEKGRRSNVLQIVLRPLWRLFSAYLPRGGFLEGLPGLVSSLICAYYVFLKWTILHEIRAKDDSDHRV